MARIQAQVIRQSILRQVRNTIRPQLTKRCYSSTPKAASPPPRSQQPKSHARDGAANKSAPGSSSKESHAISEKLLIYHSGTGRTTFLAMIKVTSLFIGAFFTFVAVPSAVKNEKPPQEIAQAALCGIIPLLFITYTTSPFVTHAHIHLPTAARISRPALERFVGNIPPTTQLTLTTMSFVSKPRYSSVRAGDLFPVRRRFGLINYARDTQTENEARKWYMYRAVKGFHIQEKSAVVPGKRYQKKKKDLVEGWIWEAIKERIHARATSKQM